MFTITADFRAGLRQFVHRPAWSANVVLVLGLGLGIALACFVLTDAVLFRPLGIADPERVVRIGGTGPERAWLNSSSWPSYEGQRASSDVFSGVAAEGYPDPLHWRLADGSRVRVAGKLVTGNYFEVLGVPAAVGRVIGPDDDRPNSDRVVVVSDRFWRRHLGARADAIGAAATIGSDAHTIVGVMAPEFRGMALEAVDVWVAVHPALGASPIWTDHGWSMFDVFARLRPGVTIAQASAAADTVMRRLREDVPDSNDVHAMAVPAAPAASAFRNEGARNSALLLDAGALLILLAACANAAGLLLVRGERRRLEFAVRATLGAGPVRLARQLFVEAALLALAGAALGVALAVALVRLAFSVAAVDQVLALAPDALPAAWRAGAMLVAATVAVALCSGVWPALRPLRRDIAGDVRRNATAGASGGRRWRTGRALVVAQFALTVALVAAAGLLARSLFNVWHTPLGFTADATRVARLDYSVDFDDRAGFDQRNAAMLRRLGSAPGVEAAAIGGMVPISTSSMSTQVWSPQRTDGAAGAIGVLQNPVSPRFFDAVGTRVLAGRAFDERDNATSASVAIISRQFAQQYLSGVDAVGRTLLIGEKRTPATIVGVVDDVRYRPFDEPLKPMLYLPLEQRGFGAMFHALARPMPGAGEAAAAALRAATVAIEPERAAPQASTLGERVAATIAGPRFLAAAVGAFAVLALLLAAVGIYGAFAFLVSVRQREIGLRLALGSSPDQVARLVVGDGARVVAAGVSLGLLGTLLGSRLLAGTLVGVGAQDATTLGVVCAVVAGVGLLALAIPAKAAARLDPQQSLRCE